MPGRLTVVLALRAKDLKGRKYVESRSPTPPHASCPSYSLLSSKLSSRRLMPSQYQSRISQFLMVAGPKSFQCKGNFGAGLIVVGGDLVLVGLRQCGSSG